MRRRCLLSAGAVAVVLLCLRAVPADDEPDAGGAAQDAGAPGGADDQAAMEAWMKIATPGENHKFLEQFVGDWDVTMRMWMEGPDGPAVESSGSSTVRMILGGRYLQEEFQGEMFGMPFEGRGTTGYDNFRKQFVGSWIDSMGTSMMVLHGHLDQTGTALTMYGSMDEATTGEVGKPLKYVTRVVDEDRHVFEMYDLVASEDYPIFAITYTRREQ